MPFPKNSYLYSLVVDLFYSLKKNCILKVKAVALLLLITEPQIKLLSVLQLFIKIFQEESFIIRQLCHLAAPLFICTHMYFTSWRILKVKYRCARKLRVLE